MCYYIKIYLCIVPALHAWLNKRNVLATKNAPTSTSKCKTEIFLFNKHKILATRFGSGHNFIKKARSPRRPPALQYIKLQANKFRGQIYNWKSISKERNLCRTRPESKKHYHNAE